jgi:hypothetical protein
MSCFLSRFTSHPFRQEVCGLRAQWAGGALQARRDTGFIIADRPSLYIASDHFNPKISDDRIPVLL